MFRRAFRNGSSIEVKRSDIDAVARDKAKLREKLAALPFDEKLKLLDAMRERALAFKNATPIEEPAAANEPKATYMNATQPAHSPLPIDSARAHLHAFEFDKLFIEDLGWNRAKRSKPVSFTVGDANFTRREIAHLGDVPVFEVTGSAGEIPSAKELKAVNAEIAKHHAEHLLIFIDGDARSKSLWQWVKRDGGKRLPREHSFWRSQSGDLFLSKLRDLHFDLSDLDARGETTVIAVAERLRKALDIEVVTKKFYREFEVEHIAFLEHIGGIDDERDRKWYASVLMNRLMFIWFLQRKGFLDNGDTDYLPNKLAASTKSGRAAFYSGFLQALFFQGFAVPEDKRSAAVNALLGRVKYLNGGLFVKHPIEDRWPEIRIDDKAFENLFDLFRRYSWNLNDTPGGDERTLNPDVLGYIFEKYINQKQFGAYYTRTEITEYICEHTVESLILDRVHDSGVTGARRFESVSEMLHRLDRPTCALLLTDVLPTISLLDPACGSGAFLVAALRSLMKVYEVVLGWVIANDDRNLKRELEKIRGNHREIGYGIKKAIITRNLFGVDIMEEATEIAKLRLFLTLVASAESVDQLEPLPNIDFNIMAGNSLIGLLQVRDSDYDAKHIGQEKLFTRSYREILDEKNRQIDNYRKTAAFGDDLRALRNGIAERKRDDYAVLDEILAQRFVERGIKVEEATWDEKKKTEGKPKKRGIRLDDVTALHPFHWGYEFDTIMNERGGFDAVITNPPWEIFKPNGKEFLEHYSDLVTRKKMTIEDFEKEKSHLLKEPEVRTAWLNYLTGYPHVSAYYRSAEQYKNQISVVNGKKQGTDINLYKLFLEQCFNLLRRGGHCGIVIPSGIYTDLGTKQLREMLFGETSVTGLFCFENRKEIFEGVHRSFKFVVLTFEKGHTTTSFPAAFMRHEVTELRDFPRAGAIEISVELVRRLSPDSVSVMEFKSPLDVQIVEKMRRFPLLGEEIPGTWSIKFSAEFHMTNDSHLFKTSPGKGRLPLYEGKMIWQFDHKLAGPRFWITEAEGRRAVVSSIGGQDQELNYQLLRLGFRDVAASTNERTLISTVIPPRSFAGNTLVTTVGEYPGSVLLFVAGVFNSFVVDWVIRLKVTNHCNMFYMYQLPIPRVQHAPRSEASPPHFERIVALAGRLVCTAVEFDGLAKAVGLGSHRGGTLDPVGRAQTRAVLDAHVAHLYDLTEEEFTHILSTFPLVEQKVKDDALDAYRALAPRPEAEEVKALIAGGESHRVEFKSSARWDLREHRASKELEKVIVKTVAGFLNTDGGTLLIGVDDEGVVVGLQNDYKTLGMKPNRDGFENWLTGMLLAEFGKEFAPSIRITFASITSDASSEICRVECAKSSKPAWITDSAGEHLFIRTGNSTRQLTAREAVEWVGRG